jgi:hypothetical protein
MSREFKRINPTGEWAYTFRRKSFERLNPVLAKKRLKGAIIVIIEYQESFFAGISCCSKHDTWDYELGEEIAYQRAKLAAHHSGLLTRNFSLDSLEEDLDNFDRKMLTLAREILVGVTLDPYPKLHWPNPAQRRAKHRTRVDYIPVSQGTIPLGVSI